MKSSRRPQEGRGERRKAARGAQAPAERRGDEARHDIDKAGRRFEEARGRENQSQNLIALRRYGLCSLFEANPDHGHLHRCRRLSGEGRDLQGRPSARARPHVVANSFIRTPMEPRIKVILVDAGPDIADDWIAERAVARWW
jgi:hypothetical protein